MVVNTLSWSGVLIRLVAALVLVFGTWNPNGWSYYQWAILPVLDDAGSFNAVKFLVGQVMRETRGRANPQVAQDLLSRELS